MTRIAQCLLALAIFFIVLLLFWPGVSGGFLFDDHHNIVTNAFVQIKELSTASLWKASQGFSDGTRQLAMVSFALNAYWAGLDPWAYKVTGLLVHAGNAVLVFMLALRLLAFSSLINPRHQRMAALALALVWALHPIQVSSALYVVQRMETLCFTFLFIALLLYMRIRNQQITGEPVKFWLWSGLLLSFVLAALFKESAVLLPLFCLALEATVLGFAGSNGQRRFWRISYGAGSALALLAFVFWAVPHYSSLESYGGRDFNTVERLLTQGRVLWLYIQQMLLPLPTNLYFYYDDMAVSRGWLQPLTTLPAIAGLVLLFTLAIYWRKRFTLAALGILWFFAAHFITSNVIGLEMVFEHRNYFALLGILLVVVELVSRLPVRDGPAIKYAGVAVLVLGVGFLGAVRAATWGNPILLATDMTSKNPNSARAAMDMGVAYFELSDGDSNSPFYHFAARQFERASALQGASTLPDVNLILMHGAAGFPDDLVDIDVVWQRYLQRLQALHLSVETRESVWSLLQQRLNARDIDDYRLLQAMAIIFERQEQPDYRHAMMADYLLVHLGQYEQAEAHYRLAISKARESGNQQLIERIAADLAASGYSQLASELTGLTMAPENILLNRLKLDSALLPQLDQGGN
jgi:tetratricopeptide (TPR) repeat protein